MLLCMLSFATPVGASSPSINEPLGCCNPCEYPSGSRKELLWISSCDCLGVSLDMFPFGGNCGPTSQGSSLQACQDNLHQTTTSIVVYV
jgi:hypothetical protein